MYHLPRAWKIPIHHWNHPGTSTTSMAHIGNRYLLLFDNAQRNDRFKNSESNGNQDGDTSQRNNTGNFRGRGQGRGNFRSNIRGKGRGRGRFDKSPNIRRPRVASKTVDKDKMRCHYCNEFVHFIRECSKKNRDENVMV